MTLSKRNSRKIVIDGTAYRWAPSIDSGFYVLVAHLENKKGQQVEIIVDSSEHIINENGYTSGWILDENGKRPFVLRPANVEILLRKSLQSGWEPEKKGPVCRFQFLKGKLQTF